MVYGEGGAEEEALWKVHMEGGDPVRLNDAEADVLLSRLTERRSLTSTKTLRQILRVESQSWHSKAGNRRSVSTFRNERGFGGR